MRNYMELLRLKNGSNGFDSYAINFSKMDESKQIDYVWNKFTSYAKKRAKYFFKKHSMDLLECESFISSGLFDLFLNKKKNLIKKYGDFSAVNYYALKRVFTWLKITVAKVNYIEGGIYLNTKCKLPESEISFKDAEGSVYKYVIPAINRHDTLDKTITKTIPTQNMDLIDILQRVINRESRAEQKIRNAIYELQVRENITVQNNSKDYMTEFELKEVRRMEKKLLEESSNTFVKVQELTRLSGHYATPEESLINKCEHEKSLLLAGGERFKNILESKKPISKMEREFLRRWRHHNGCGNVRIEDLREYFLG